MIRLIIAAPETGSTSPASKIGVAPKSIPVSLHMFADSEANADRISGGASAGPRINEEVSSQGTPIRASRIDIVISFQSCLTLSGSVKVAGRVFPGTACFTRLTVLQGIL